MIETAGAWRKSSAGEKGHLSKVQEHLSGSGRLGQVILKRG